MQIRPALALAAFIGTVPPLAAAQDTPVPRLLIETCTRPTYPDAAQRENRTGTVKARVQVDKTGKPTETRILKSSAHADLDEAFIKMLKSCSYRPAVIAGVPAPASVVVDYVWRIE